MCAYWNRRLFFFEWRHSGEISAMKLPVLKRSIFLTRASGIRLSIHSDHLIRAMIRGGYLKTFLLRNGSRPISESAARSDRIFGVQKTAARLILWRKRTMGSR